MSKRILFVPIHGASLLEMLPIAQKLDSDGIFEPLFFIYRDIQKRHIKHLDENEIKQLKPKNWKGTGPKTEPKYDFNNAKDGGKFESTDFRKRMITKLLSWDWFSFLFYFLKFSQHLIHSRKYLRSEDISAVLVVGDRHVGWETALIKVANQLDIPTLIVPFALSDPGSDAFGRLQKEDLEQYRVSSRFRRLVSRIFPNWVQETKEGPLFFYPIGEALAAKMLGMIPKYPWSIGGGAAKRMAVESSNVFENYLQEGIPPSKMIITGKPSVDQIYSHIKKLDYKKLREKLGIDQYKSVILCSVPQLAEHSLLSWEEHWREVDFLLASLSTESGVVLLLSLHPQSNPDAYRTIAKKYGAIIATNRIYDLIPMCDFLVATYSSIVVQAIGCGKPVIVVDFFGLNSPYFNEEPGVIVVKERDTLVPMVKKLLYDKDAYQEFANSQRKSSSKWILLDGQCTQRVTNLLYEMIDLNDH